MKSTSKQMAKENMLMEQKLLNLKERLQGEKDARRYNLSVFEIFSGYRSRKAKFFFKSNV